MMSLIFTITGKEETENRIEHFVKKTRQLKTQQ